ncbi:MAG TPA: L-serine ammonia-lyase, iron-sulfur-dependent, subunit alpha [Opitutales bacterium]|nr:L-serine ammonia-lyase, iron-sulfur-dependent, subunit alpha [Opitutales bacterium]
MQSPPPSIFNDVLGPVMRGPSSSHSAAANRIGRLARDLVAGPIKKVIVRYDPNGSLVTTHKDQGTDLGLYSGLLGWTPEDSRIPGYEAALEEAGIEIDLRYESYDAPHPNFYRLELFDGNGREFRLDAISTGGGMIELRAIDGVEILSEGDFHHTLAWLEEEPEASFFDEFDAVAEGVGWHPSVNGGGIFNVFSRQALDGSFIEKLERQPGCRQVRQLQVVLPVLSRRGLKVGFQRAGEMLEQAELVDQPLGICGLRYESERSGLGEEELRAMMDDLITVFEAAVKTGLAGTDYADRVLPSQSPGFQRAEEAGTLVPANINNQIIRYVSAIMEVKSSLGVIVAAPTAGSCGAMPGAVLAVGHAMGKDRKEIGEALFAAGLIGVFIARDATFAAEEGGCMAETGSGASMAAAAIVQLAGGNQAQQLAAASMALQNAFGLVCDPVANRVEAPCLGKNIMAATNALSCANMALAGYDPLIPMDEVVKSMNEVAHQMPRELRCTNLGGLAITPTSKKIAERLKSGAGCGSRKCAC